MSKVEDRYPVTPFKITTIYVVFGVAYILVSDYLTFILVEAPGLRSQIQTLKGWGFVVVSGALIFGMTRYHHHQLRDANEDLTDTLQQVHILHRILRHNLRNKCNIIIGNADHVLADGGTDAAETIKHQTDELVKLSEKTQILREATTATTGMVDINLVHVVTDVVEEIKGSHPSVVIRTDFPTETVVKAHPRLRDVIHELVVNAITHGGDGPVTVRIVDDDDENAASVSVSDQGPGLPRVERIVLTEGFLETPTQHSQGIGLWLVRYLVSRSDGSLMIESTDDGTTVQMRLLQSDDSAVTKFLR